MAGTDCLSVIIHKNSVSTRICFKNQSFKWIKTYQEIKDTQPQHLKAKADVAVVVKPLGHLDTQTAHKWS